GAAVQGSDTAPQPEDRGTRTLVEPRQQSLRPIAKAEVRFRSLKLLTPAILSRQRVLRTAIPRSIARRPTGQRNQAGRRALAADRKRSSESASETLGHKLPPRKYAGNAVCTSICGWQPARDTSRYGAAHKSVYHT